MFKRSITYESSYVLNTINYAIKKKECRFEAKKLVHFLAIKRKEILFFGCMDTKKEKWESKWEKSFNPIIQSMFYRTTFPSDYTDCYYSSHMHEKLCLFFIEQGNFSPPYLLAAFSFVFALLPLHHTPFTFHVSFICCDTCEWIQMYAMIKGKECNKNYSVM